MVRHSLDSVNEFARQGYDLRITCSNCGYVSEASALQMMKLLHQRKIGLQVELVERRMKCSQCGHRGARISPCDPF